MSYRRIRRTAARGTGARGARALATGCALAALGLAAGPAPGALAAPAERTPTAVAAAAPDATAHTVTLVTGERVTLGADGSVVVAPRPGAEADYVTRRLDNDVFVIPLTALPYLGRTLDPALFNVSALAEAGVTTTPVRVAAKAGATAPRSGPAFGAALAKQVGAEAAEGSVGDRPLFGGVTSVVPAVATAGGRAAARPAARADRARRDHTRADHPVKVTVLGTDGKPLPGTTPFALANVDDATRYREPSLQAVDGEARAEVPAGRYSAMVSAPTFDRAGESTGIHMATAEFTVSDGAAGTDVVLDLRKATERVTFSTPRPAEEHQLILHYLRDDTKGEVAVNGGVGVSSGAPVYVQPSSRPVTTGDLRFNVYTHRKAPADAATPYSYDLKLANPAGVIAKNQHYQVTGRQLATVRTNYHSDTPGRAQEVARLMYLPYESSGEALSEPFKTPRGGSSTWAARRAPPTTTGSRPGSGASCPRSRLCGPAGPPRSTGCAARSPRASPSPRGAPQRTRRGTARRAARATPSPSPRPWSWTPPPPRPRVPVRHHLLALRGGLRRHDPVRGRRRLRRRPDRAAAEGPVHGGVRPDQDERRVPPVADHAHRVDLLLGPLGRPDRAGQLDLCLGGGRVRRARRVLGAAGRRPALPARRGAGRHQPGR
ncbi:hypothetical protein ACFQ10_42755 [Streptomyces indonesiensis]